MDVLADEEALERFRAHIAPRKLFCISAATTEGVDALVKYTYERLSQLPPITVFEPEAAPEIIPPGPQDITIRLEDGLWVIEGEWLAKLMGGVNFSDYESKMYFDRTLRKYGVFDAMEAAGVEDKDMVYMYGLEYEYSI